MDVPGKWINRVRQHRSLDKMILDLNPGAPGVSQTDGGRERQASAARLVRVRCVLLFANSCGEYQMSFNSWPLNCSRMIG